MFDPYAALARTMEREESLLWNLKELLTSIDTSAIGPAVKLVPKWQLERIESAIEASEEELRMLEEVLDEVEDDDASG